MAEATVLALRAWEGADGLSPALMAGILRELAVAFPAVQRTDDKLVRMAEVYYRALRDYPVTAIRAASEKAIRDEEHFPKVAILRRLAADAHRATGPTRTTTM